MSRLNRAFIKAYSRDDSRSVEAIGHREPATTIALPAAADSMASAGRPIVDNNRCSADCRNGHACSRPGQELMAEPSASATETVEGYPPNQIDRLDDASTQETEAALRPWETADLTATSMHWSELSNLPVDGSEPTGPRAASDHDGGGSLRYDSAHAHAALAEPSWKCASSSLRGLNAVATHDDPWPDQHELVRAELLPAGHGSSCGLLEPALQVDRFAWPELCVTLIDRADADFARLVDELFADSDRKLLAVTGYGQNQGQTTLVLCIARALAARGARIALVDAAPRPRLAARLGVSPEAGWQETRRRRLPLDEALIESSIDGVTLLPASVQGDRSQPLELGSLYEDLRRLREAYDFVLVDAGPLDDGRALFEQARFDGAILVHDVSKSSFVNPSITERSLSRLRIGWWRIAENFTPTRKPRN